MIEAHRSTSMQSTEHDQNHHPDDVVILASEDALAFRKPEIREQECARKRRIPSHETEDQRDAQGQFAIGYKKREQDLIGKYHSLHER